VGETFEHEGRVLQRLEALHGRRYVSVFGELEVERHVYGTREGQKLEVVPLDARVGLPEGDYSQLLRQWDQSLCVRDSYEESRCTIEQILGLRQSVRALEQMNRGMATSVEAFREQQPAPPAEQEGPILVLTADGKGVPMRRGQDEPAPEGRRRAGEKANKKRVADFGELSRAVVGACYTIQPFVRTAQEVVDEVMREQAKARRPRPIHKRVRAELTREVEVEGERGVEQVSEVNGKDVVFGWFREQCCRRNGDSSKVVVCLMDGERRLWKAAARCFGGLVAAVVCVLDVFHMLERLTSASSVEPWAAAHCFFPENSPQAKAFVAERLRRVLEGEAGRVIGGLRQMGTKRGLKGAKLKQLNKALNYLRNNLPHMRYDQYLAAGHPIGRLRRAQSSRGVAEGACRHLVKDRMELTGMRWTTKGAQAMLDVRSMYLGDDWEDFNQYRIEQETKRLYPYRDAIEHCYQNAA
jgi:hypothetical protein